MRLAHIHFAKPVPYLSTLRLQEAILETHFAYNNHLLRTPKSGPVANTTVPAPTPPTLLTFQSQPIYTVGRRQLNANPLPQSQINFLTTNGNTPAAEGSKDVAELASFYPSTRGGLLTYHAPGQLTAYLIINLRFHGITPRCFVRLLEQAVIKTCARHGVKNALTTTDPGVWIGEKDPTGPRFEEAGKSAPSGASNLIATDRKICAVGVHVTRGITSHGLGLNIFDAPVIPAETARLYTLPMRQDRDPELAPGYLSWGFERITACGLEGKSVTWLTREGAALDTSVEDVTESLRHEICDGLTRMGKVEIKGVKNIPLSQEELLSGGSGLSIGDSD